MDASLAKRALERWIADGVVRDDDEVHRAGAALDSLEKKHGIVLPPSFRELWSLSDGTGAMDRDEFTFWPLDNITNDPGLGPWQGLLVFADHRLCTKIFCVRFEGERACDVVDTERRRVAESFDQFLEKYLANGRALAGARSVNST
jgi:hypothetical protein